MRGIVYILRFTKSGRYYVGSTDDLERRLIQHRQGHTSTTYRGGEFTLVFSQVVESLSLARSVEHKIKAWKRRDFIEKIVREQKIRLLDNGL